MDLEGFIGLALFAGEAMVELKVFKKRQRQVPSSDGALHFKNRLAVKMLCLAESILLTLILRRREAQLWAAVSDTDRP
jgi:hypothetical protein